MNLDAITAQLTAFSSEGIGKVIKDVLWTIYSLLYPANADAARPVAIPK